MKSFLFLCSIVLNISVFAQDTISVMAYNLLNYNSANTSKTRYKDLKVIIAYAKPDAVLVNELVDAGGAQLLLDSAFNAAGVGTYSRSAFVNGFDSDNALFYKPSKLGLRSQQQILTSLRDISQYRVYSVITPGDTAWMYLHSAHLKAGNTNSDANDRNNEAAVFCASVSVISPTQNVVLAGDFNLYDNAEPAWNTLTSAQCSHRLYDPINVVGSWNDNSAYKHVHTQSTRSSANPGCCGGATGGMDDRFDFILTNSSLMNGTNKVRVLPSTYKAIGNDSQHFNLSIISAPTNTAIPANVTTALFNMSDHLPVFSKFLVGNSVNITSVTENNSQSNFRIFASSNGSENFLKALVPETGIYSLTIYNATGSIIADKSVSLYAGNNTIDGISMLNENGMYIAVLTLNGNSKACLFPFFNR